MYPSIVVSGSFVHVVWQDEQDWNDEIYYRRSTDAGLTWGSQIRLTNAIDKSRTASITADGSNVHVVWSDMRDGNYEIYYMNSHDNGTYWEVDERLTTENEVSRHPSIAVFEDWVHVVWTDERDGNSEIYYMSDPSGNSDCGSSTLRILIHSGKAVPNPFKQYTRIPGMEHDAFRIYDAAGSYVRTCVGNYVGSDLPVGVYMIVTEKTYVMPIKIIKMR
jgi:hypothetical protein